MTSGQVSIWVPVAVAVLGIVGVVAGQLVNAWREDRRWQREVAREDLRWQREQQREIQKQEHDIRAHWRHERLAAYDQYARLMEDWSEVLVRAVMHQLEDKKIADEDFDMMRDLNRKAKEALTKILLVGSSDLQAQCHELLALYGSSYHALKGGRAVLPANEYPQDALGDAYFHLINQTRLELGIGPLDGFDSDDDPA